MIITQRRSFPNVEMSVIVSNLQLQRPDALTLLLQPLHQRFDSFVDILSTILAEPT